MLKSQKIELLLLDAVIQHSDPSGRSFHIADLTPYLSNKVGSCEHREVIAALQRLKKNDRITIGHWEGTDWIPYDIGDGTAMFYNYTFSFAATPETWPYFEELKKGNRAGVFISHISDERELATHIQAFLKRVFGPTFSVFVSSDYQSIKSGKPWYSEILDGLRSAQVVLVLLTPQSIDRRWINFEAGFGMGQEAEVVPITGRLGKSGIGFPLGQLQARDLYDYQDVEQLLNDIATLCDTKVGVADISRFQAELDQLERKLPTTSIEFLTRRQNNQLQFAIRNNGSKPVDLVEAEILVPKGIVGPGFHFLDEPTVRKGLRQTVGEIEYGGFRLTSIPSSRPGSGIEPLPPTLTRDMGIREVRSIAITLKPNLSSEELAMSIRYRLTGKQISTGNLEIRLGDLPPEWPADQT